MPDRQEAFAKTWQCPRCAATLISTAASSGARCANLHPEVEMALVQVHWR